MQDTGMTATIETDVELYWVRSAVAKSYTDRGSGDWHLGYTLCEDTDVLCAAMPGSGRSWHYQRRSPAEGTDQVCAACLAGASRTEGAS